MVLREVAEVVLKEEEEHVVAEVVGEEEDNKKRVIFGNQNNIYDKKMFSKVDFYDKKTPNNHPAGLNFNI